MFFKKRYPVINENRMKNRTRLTLIYIIGVIVPLVLTDTVFLSIFIQNQRERTRIEMENEAESVKNLLENAFNDAADVTRSIYVNENVNKFLEASFATPNEYYEKCYDMKTNFFDFFTSGKDQTVTNIEIYANNPTIINGGYLKRLSAAEEKIWYSEFKNSGRTAYLCCYYIGNEEPTATRKKRITLIRNMDYFRNSVRQKVVKVDIDYTPLVRKVTDMKYPYDMYLCIGDKIILSTVGHNGVGEDFDHLTGDETIGIENEWNIYGQNFRILIARPRVSELGKLSDYSGGLVAVILLNIALPFILISFINQSFENRIGRQQADIARQNAELLAMQSQINPHFLFNVLESVRMHSVLKSEHETASMIEKLAVLVRQNVNWKDDETSIEDEVKFIEDYLLLQKYRFGDKLSYEIELADECRSLMIPRLTLVTFVENSCVHGMERKTSPSWIYVRIYIRNEELVMEIEDTGSGMDENEATQLCDHMNNAVIDDLKKNNHIGVINACIRLKIYTDSRAKFELESEEGVGTFTVIKVPVDSLGVGRKEEADES